MDLGLRGGQNGRRGLAKVIRRHTGTEATDLRPTPLPGVDPSVRWPAWPVLQEDGHLENECYNFPDFQVTWEPGVEAEVGGPGAGAVMLVQCPCTGLPLQGRGL